MCGPIGLSFNPRVGVVGQLVRLSIVLLVLFQQQDSFRLAHLSSMLIGPIVLSHYLMFRLAPETIRPSQKGGWTERNFTLFHFVMLVVQQRGREAMMMERKRNKTTVRMSGTDTRRCEVLDQHHRVNLLMQMLSNVPFHLWLSWSCPRRPFTNAWTFSKQTEVWVQEDESYTSICYFFVIESNCKNTWSIY